MNIINEFFVSFILIKLYFKFKVCRKIKFPLLWKFYFSKWKFYFSADKISLIEAAKIHYGKAIITEEMIERLERPYRELYEQYKKLSINEQGKFLHNLLLNNQDEYAEAIRFIQIAEESVNIALKSKNKDIAESRRKLALEIEQKIQKGYPKAYGLIIDIIQLLEDNYDVNLFENQCIKYYEEAQKLKTIKSKQKRIDYINDLIKEAEINPKIDEKFVNFWKNKVKEIQ
ncbi:hypothetical protein HX516_001713 [Campylobacter jejuni]|nr:hypothetical protein [Campylobacter jejuni]